MQNEIVNNFDIEHGGHLDICQTNTHSWHCGTDLVAMEDIIKMMDIFYDEEDELLDIFPKKQSWLTG